MKDQFVIAYLPSCEVSDTVLPYALRLAAMLGKGLILFHVDDPRYPSRHVDEAQLKALQHRLKHGNDIPAKEEWQPVVADITYCILHQDTRTALDTAATVLNGVAVVAAVQEDAKRKTPTHYKELLHNFSQCRIAFLTVQQQRAAAANVADVAHLPALKDIAFSVDFKKESKEKLVWASYFARFNHSRLHVLYDNYHDEGLKGKWYNNMKFLTRFFNSLSLTYTPHPVDVGFAVFAEPVLLDKAVELGCDLLVSTTTDLRAKDSLEFIIGTQEMRTIRNGHRLPVLFLNPRDDIYVLCD